MSESCRGEHLAVGTEILLGQIANSHARTVSLEFANNGFFIYHHSAVGDNMGRIVEAFRVAASRSNVVVVTGGLGPTADDLTKEALAQFLGRRLVMSEEALRQIEAYFRSRQRKMPEQNRKQALCIEGGEMIANPNGTAPGLYIEAGGVHYFLLPGPPLEMVPMLRNEVLPRLRRLFPHEQVLVSRVLHFCGIGESDVDEQIPHLLAQANPTVAPLAGEGEMLLRITASAPDEAAARARIAEVETELRQRFSRYIYGVDDESLPSVVGKLLRTRGETLAVAESCTGGGLSSMITGVPGSSAYYLGGVVAYHNRVKEQVLGVPAATLAEFGAVSEQTARAMAEGVRRLFGADWGMATTGIAGPDGGTPEKPVGLVYVAVAGAGGTQVYRLQLRGSREQIRLRASKQVLWRMWQALAGYEPRAGAN
ncbi:competence/damage-inducible protein A [Alicyclobacillus macrosporangiidus]|jgi:nicotinamide-nucleotide amidase|uniref:Putative competence-damage inducible protein n=1 Tax=Alicyclobacillus macrosporangiidus TaxID=392015 RepID=A0A1I7ITB7_9BACL|nr:competence/damage-inducible protein A [Alicyclobacillus macrosporangiidus]SFU76131.1 nicotinamide-nucleotide amidase [Alicyclobacillus macrosporangiidus]